MFVICWFCFFFSFVLFSFYVILCDLLFTWVYFLGGGRIDVRSPNGELWFLELFHFILFSFLLWFLWDWINHIFVSRSCFFYGEWLIAIHCPIWNVNHLKYDHCDHITSLQWQRRWTLLKSKCQKGKDEKNRKKRKKKIKRLTSAETIKQIKMHEWLVAATWNYLLCWN